MDLIGQHFGSYVAVKKLGAGGMGTVYLCEHTMIDRKVAVKVLHEEHTLDADQVDRFFQEARAAAEIGHPNIITIIDAGMVATPGGQRAFMMMEALDGESLDKTMERGGLDLEQIRHVLVQCASALTASHGKGIVHRDLKPANIFLCHHAFDPLFVKVLDFGIAKLTAPREHARKTQFGIVLGTPAYMSPEQCEGLGAIDHRSDIYSLGVMLYELLTGTLPFSGDIREILLAHLQSRPEPPSRRNPRIPPTWEALCLHMLEIRKEDRPQSMQEVALALEDLDRHAAVWAAALIVVARVPPKKILARLDWSVLVFFAGLFVVVAGLQATGLVERGYRALAPVIGRGDAIGDAAFVGLTTVGSNLVSNVPLVVIAVRWVPAMPDPTWGYVMLAVASTLAGNLTLLGSAANVIVLETAGPRGELGFWRFVRYGAVLTAVSLVIAFGLLELERAVGYAGWLGV